MSLCVGGDVFVFVSLCVCGGGGVQKIFFVQDLFI